MTRRRFWVLMAGLVITGAGLIWLQRAQTQASGLPPKLTTSQQIDLLHGHDWADFAGAAQTAQGVTVSPLGRKIVHQDGSGGQPNPPVNVAGPQLDFKANFVLRLKLESFQAGDSVQLYRGVPLIYDEWRYEPPSLQLTLLKQRLQVSLWDGSGSAPASVKQFRLTTTALHNLQLERRGTKLFITIDGKAVGSLAAPQVLAPGSLWFGLDTTNKPWTLAALSVTAPTGSMSIHDGLTSGRSPQAGPTLAGLAANHTPALKIGAAVALNPLMTDSRYRALALNQFSMWTTENDLKPQFVHPQPNVYSFQEADLLVNTALHNGIAVHGHTLVFGEANPRWMQDTPPAARQQVMVNHITTVMTHFKGRVKEWDVIDEPLSDEDADYMNGGDGLRHHIWYQAMGSNYLAIALRTAHAADPSAKLYINDYGLEADGERWTALLALIKNLQAQAVPLDGIGFEAHVYDDGDHIDPPVLERHMEELAHLGLQSRISEIDVHGEDPAVQAEEYGGVLAACRQEPSCQAFSTWGITDKYGSTTDTGVYPLSYGDDLLWSANYQPKAAETRLLQLLSK